MTAQFSAGKFPFSKISIFHTEFSDLGKLASFFASLPEDCAAVFDRLLWAQLSSGQMPAQPFPFPGITVQNCAAVFHNESLPIIEEVAEKFEISDIEFSGEAGECFEVEEDFEESMFLMFLRAEKTSHPDNMMVCSLKTDRGSIQICVGYSLYPAEEWLEGMDSQRGYYFFAPSFELRSELDERVQDKERIHLDEEIRGVHL